MSGSNGRRSIPQATAATTATSVSSSGIDIPFADKNTLNNHNVINNYNTPTSYTYQQQHYTQNTGGSFWKKLPPCETTHQSKFAIQHHNQPQRQKQSQHSFSININTNHNTYSATFWKNSLHALQHIEKQQRHQSRQHMISQRIRLFFRHKSTVVIQGPRELYSFGRKDWDLHYGAVGEPSSIYKQLNAGLYIGYASASASAIIEMGYKWDYGKFLQFIWQLLDDVAPYPRANKTIFIDSPLRT